MIMFRIGYGEDIHKFAQGRKLFLCGIEIPFELGLEGHSDADVALHALSDALLSSLALGDIGKYFPPEDDSIEGIDSKIILKECYEMVLKKGYKLSNATIFIIAEKPKLKKYIFDMRSSIANVMKVDEELIAVSAGTNEGLDEIGRGKGIKCVANVLVERADI